MGMTNLQLRFGADLPNDLRPPRIPPGVSGYDTFTRTTAAPATCSSASARRQ